MKRPRSTGDGLADLGHGIAWAGFWIGLAWALVGGAFG